MVILEEAFVAKRVPWRNQFLGEVLGWNGREQADFAKESNNIIPCYEMWHDVRHCIGLRSGKTESLFGTFSSRNTAVLPQRRRLCPCPKQNAGATNKASCGKDHCAISWCKLALAAILHHETCRRHQDPSCLAYASRSMRNAFLHHLLQQRHNRFQGRSLRVFLHTFLHHKKVIRTKSSNGFRESSTEIRKSKRACLDGQTWTPCPQ